MAYSHAYAAMIPISVKRAPSELFFSLVCNQHLNIMENLSTIKRLQYARDYVEHAQITLRLCYSGLEEGEEKDEIVLEASRLQASMNKIDRLIRKKEGQ